MHNSFIHNNCDGWQDLITGHTLGASSPFDETLRSLNKHNAPLVCLVKM